MIVANSSLTITSLIVIALSSPDGLLPSLKVHAFASPTKISNWHLTKSPHSLIGTPRDPSMGIHHSFLFIDQNRQNYVPSLTTLLFASSTDDSSSASNIQSLPQPSEMKLREIQSELKQRNVSYADCFDRESLTKRLMEARSKNPMSDIGMNADTNSGSVEIKDSAPPSSSPSTETTTTPAPSSTRTTNSSSPEFDRQSTLAHLRSLKIKDLRTRLSQYNVRWGTMIEKEELVQALCNVLEKQFEQSQNFSRSGDLTPGKVVEVNENVLLEELGWSDFNLSKGIDVPSDKPMTHPFLLGDFFATWCGPCQFLVPHLQEAAEELGPSVRVVKLDSDKYPRLASMLKVGGLPTLILFDGGDVSREVDRVEGALKKYGILQFVKQHLIN